MDARQSRHERGAHGTFGKEIAKEARDAGRDAEGVGRVRGGEVGALHDLPDEAEQPAGEGRRRR